MERNIPKTLKLEEFTKLIKAVEHPKHKMAYMLGFFCCMRISEVTKLKPEDIDKNTRIMRILQAKGKKDRNIPIAPECMPGLKHLPIGVCDRAIQKSFKLDCIKHLGSEYSWCHFHTLRHSGATYYLNVKKWDIRQIQQFLGHSNIGITEIYTHVNPSDLVERMWS